MADSQDDELLLDREAEADELVPNDEQQADANQVPEGDEFEEEVSFGDGAAPAPGEGETPLIKHLREQLREAQKEREQYRKAASSQQELGAKPTLETCEYDEDRFEAALDEWKERKREIEAAQSSPSNPQVQAQEQWNRDYQAYQQKRASLTFADRDEVEATATAALNEVQQAVIVQSAENPALLLYALGRNPAKLAEISQISNPLKMAAAVAKLEGALKVNRKRKAPEPERIERGSARIAARGTDKELERLEKEAERTGERTALRQYRAKLKSRAS